MFLYMQHPHKPLPAAAHSLFCAVIQQTKQVSYSQLSCFVKKDNRIITVSPVDYRHWVPCMSLHKWLSGWLSLSCNHAGLFACFVCLAIWVENQVLLHVYASCVCVQKLLLLQKEQLVPFYMERALEGYPSCTPITGLSAGVDAAMRELPSGSPVVLYMFRRLAKHTYSLLQQGTNKQHGLDLLQLLTQMLLVVEFQFLSDALDTVEQVVLGTGNAVATQVPACTCIYEVLSTSDDYTRKVRCAHWYQKLASRCGPTGRQTSLRGAEELTHLLSKQSSTVASSA